jgi:hypothetical protein
MKTLTPYLYGLCLAICLLATPGSEARGQSGCTDTLACNFEPEAVTDDGSCTYTGYFIPIIVGDGPAIQACDAPAGYYFPDQICVSIVIASDPYCVETTWDSVCEGEYNSCLGCADPEIFIPYVTGSGTSIEACSPPDGYYLADQTCVWEVISNDALCTYSDWGWDWICKEAYDECFLGCESAYWFIPYIPGSGPAVYSCEGPVGYHAPSQSCLTEVLAVDDYCVETSWDFTCQSQFDDCFYLCDPLWFIPLEPGIGIAYYGCSAPPGYYSPNQSCVMSVIQSDPFCVEFDWDLACETAYNDCLDCAVQSNFYIPIVLGSGPVIETCERPDGYIGANTECMETVLANSPDCATGPWDIECMDAFDLCALECDAQWHIPYQLGLVAYYGCTAISGYYTPNQECVEQAIAADFFCLDIDVGWNESCEDVYNLCYYGCEDPVWYIPFAEGAGPAQLACEEPEGYWEALPSCIMEVLGADETCVEDNWTASCQQLYDECLLGCEDGNWFIPMIPGDGAAYYNCTPAEGYTIPDQDCVIQIISNDPFCIDGNWDSYCQLTYEDCVFGCVIASACNYDPTAIYGDDSCVFPGCTDPMAANYDPFAGCSDDSCIYVSCTGDLDGDGMISTSDLLMFLVAFGNACP